MINRQHIAQTLINKFRFHTYLEIGVQRGKNFFAVKAPRRIAVDPVFKIGLTRRLTNLPAIFSDSFYEMTSDDFFARHARKVLAKRPVDVALIDGLHTYEQVLKDFENCLKYLSPNGFILFHDCNPQSPEAAEHARSPEEVMQRHPGKTPEWNGDVWKAILHIQCHFPNINIFVVDCDYGVGVAFRKVTGRKTDLAYTKEEIEKMSYADLERNRKKFLNLEPQSYWHEFLSAL